MLASILSFTHHISLSIRRNIASKIMNVGASNQPSVIQ